MKKTFTLILFSFLFFQISYSQKTNIDSLKNELAKTNIDTVKLSNFIALSNAYLGLYPDTAVIFGKQGLELANKINHIQGKLNILTNLGIAYIYLSMPDTAIRLWEKGLKEAEKVNNLKKQADFANNLAIVYSMLDNFEKSSEYLKQTVEIADKIGYNSRKYSALNTLALNFKNKSVFNIALKYFYQIIDNDSINTEMRANVHNNIAIILGIQKKYRQSNEYFKRAIEGYKSINNLNRELLAESNIVQNYIDTKQYDNAEKLLDKTILIAESNNLKYLLQTLVYKKGVIKYKQHNYKAALRYYSKALLLAEQINKPVNIFRMFLALSRINSKINNFQEAKRYLNKAQKLSKEIKDKVLIRDFYENYADYYEESKLYKQALNYYKQFKSVSDSLSDAIKNEQAEALLVAYETQKKEQKIKLQEKQNQIQKAQIEKQQILIWLIALGAAILILLILLYIFYRSQKQKQEILKLKIEAQENIKKEIAGELHSGVGSELTATILQLENKLGKSPEVENIKNIYRHIRTASHLLALPDFVVSTIEDEINNMVTNFKTDNLEIETGIYSKKGWNDITPFVQQNIYRIVQELFTNSFKHADATNISMQLIRHEDYINLMYEDNGKGYNPDSIKSNHGYKNEILGRTDVLKGTLSDESKIGEGAILNFKFPI